MLESLLSTLAPPFAAAGLALQRADDPPEFHAATAPGIEMGPDTLWRAASLSKMVTARTLEAVSGPEVWRREAGEALGWPLRHPRWPGAPVTLGQIASHSSGLTDTAGYAVPAGRTLEDWLAEKGLAAWLPHLPGTFLHYCNLGFVLLAAAVERLGGERFDLLARRHVLDPLRIEGGFAWSGVAPERRTDRLPALRRGPGCFAPQIDDKVAAEGLSGPDGTAPTLLPLGLNPAPLSPQGGLRLSLRGALALARSLESKRPQRLWTPSMGPGDYGDGFLESTGAGLLIFDDPAFYPRPLIGHFANAYGLLAGAWHDRLRGASFAYVLNGLPEGDEDDAWHPEERLIFDAVARAL
ncbi:serine hydrolase domain-containing protein [Rubellimicrobium roseum]|uniref:Beta-lactamase family protein n=1 Tax=Rubellimicrobium roseum TaxID=687525 RepID=A0A5C4N976_9RHOB|nr:serine hydrolase domain-containing protein [Rubellimicrobium roseum]TNC62457.1 beta-lactamase family protein [Rubellimicrobium roseum]